ncbi:hypothetical protein Cadr_000011209 [Camelus dromedarius]|uniref:Uncharacterized protein n=1 Tax=Camelus dromedarius TaxID=9838 RepID=A0A5N4DV76_CAMDR|nr:hypothetical protein Cadr_000011209 [Camelus dromedarius]
MDIQRFHTAGTAGALSQPHTLTHQDSVSVTLWRHGVLQQSCQGEDGRAWEHTVGEAPLLVSPPLPRP